MEEGRLVSQLLIFMVIVWCVGFVVCFVFFFVQGFIFGGWCSLNSLIFVFYDLKIIWMEFVCIVSLVFVWFVLRC